MPQQTLLRTFSTWRHMNSPYLMPRELFLARAETSSIPAYLHVRSLRRGKQYRHT